MFQNFYLSNIATATPFIASLLLTLFGLLLYRNIKKIPLKKNKTSELAEFIKEGLHAYSTRVLTSTLQIILYITLVLLLFSTFFKQTFSWGQIIAFGLGGSISVLCATLILMMTPNTIPRIIAQSKGYLKDSLTILYKTSSAIAFLLIGLVVLGLSICCLILGIESCIGFGLGVTLTAFFLRIGGGIVKSSTDISSDIIQEVDSEIPDVDARNPAALLDIIGDYVGHITGFGFDLLGSFTFSIISAILFAYSLYNNSHITADTAEKLILLPIFIISSGLIISMITYAGAQWRIHSDNASNSLLEAIYVSVILSGASTFIILKKLQVSISTVTIFGSTEIALFIPFIFGLLGATLMGFASEYMTSSRFKPGKTLASQNQFGTVINMFNGLTSSLKSTGLFLINILLITIPAYLCAGFYGLTMASLGMLAMTSTILASCNFSPLSQNTKKFVELTQEHEDTTSANTQKLNELGQTTIALGNGFASGTAVVSTFSLFFSIVLLAKVQLPNLFHIDIKLLIGLLIGLMLPYIISGYLIEGLKKIVLQLLTEIKKQFREIPYLKENKGRPDIIQIADYNTRLSMDALIIPGIIMALTPISIAYIFGTKMLVGLTLGTCLTGFTQSYFWANLGDSLHHAKHYIQSGNYGGKNSSTFINITRADNIGDAYKDLLSPSLNIVIKSITIITALLIVLLTLSS